MHHNTLANLASSPGDGITSQRGKCCLLRSCASLLAGITIGGCATGNLPEVPQIRPNIYIAVGELVSAPTSTTLCKFRVTEDLDFMLSTNETIVVTYAANTLPKGGLPPKAILILHSRFVDVIQDVIREDNYAALPGLMYFLNWFECLGGDAYRGMLPDTPENRQLVLRKPLQDFLENTERIISPARAISIAQKFLEAKGLLPLPNGEKVFLRAYRKKYGYGWTVFSLGPHWHVDVGDDGQVKD